MYFEIIISIAVIILFLWNVVLQSCNNECERRLDNYKDYYVDKYNFKKLDRSHDNTEADVKQLRKFLNLLANKLGYRFEIYSQENVRYELEEIKKYNPEKD